MAMASSRCGTELRPTSGRPHRGEAAGRAMPVGFRMVLAVIVIAVFIFFAVH